MILCCSLLPLPGWPGSARACACCSSWSHKESISFLSFVSNSRSLFLSRLCPTLAVCLRMEQASDTMYGLGFRSPMMDQQKRRHLRPIWFVSFYIQCPSLPHHAYISCSSCYLKSAFAFWPCSNLLKTCPARGRAAVMWSLSESWQSCDYFYLVAIGSCNLRLIKTLLEPVDSVGKWEHSGCLTLSLAIQVNFQSNFNHKACQRVTSCVCFYGFALPFWINQCWEIRFKDQAQLAQLRPRKQAWSVWRRL